MSQRIGQSHCSNFFGIILTGGEAGRGGIDGEAATISPQTQSPIQAEHLIGGCTAGNPSLNRASGTTTSSSSAPSSSRSPLQLKQTGRHEGLIA